MSNDTASNHAFYCGTRSWDLLSRKSSIHHTMLVFVNWLIRVYGVIYMSDPRWLHLRSRLNFIVRQEKNLKLIVRDLKSLSWSGQAFICGSIDIQCLENIQAPPIVSHRLNVFPSLGKQAWLHGYSSITPFFPHLQNISMKLLHIGATSSLDRTVFTIFPLWRR